MFKHVTGFLIVIGSLLVGCVYYWVDHKEAGELAKNEEKYWNPIEEVPQLTDLLKKDKNTPSVVNTGKNFLLIAEHPTNADSNQIILAQYEPDTQEVQMKSIPVTEFPENSNTANEDHFKKWIEEKYKLSIDHTISIDVQGFSNLIDNLVPKGVDITVTEAMVEAYQLNMKAGTYTLHGDDLVDQQSDIKMVLLHPEVLGTIKESIMNELQGFDGMLKIPSLIKESKSYVQTDMNFNDLISMVSTLAIKGITEVESIPVTGNIEPNVDLNHPDPSFTITPLQAPIYDSNYQTGL